MSSLLSRASENSRIQLAATALVSGAVVAAGILGYQRLAREERVSRLKRSIPSPEEDGEHHPQPLTSLGTVPAPDKEDLRNEALARRAQAGDFDDELVLEQLARNRVFLTPEGLDKLRSAFVVVVGCGGVGSHCAASLARSGVSRLRLVDFDQVTLSSLNRHAVATLADVGIPKVQCLQRRLVAVAPWVRFDLRLEKFDGDSAPRLLGGWTEAEEGGRPDFVVDAIDNIDTKVALLKYCHDNGIPVISAMGAGCKSDPTKIVVGDISATTEDPLSRATRRRLKLQGVTAGIPAVFSTEKGGEGKAELLPLPDGEFQKGSVGDLGVLPDFRVRILPVLGTMPAVFGYTAANHVILSITGYPLDYAATKGRDKLYDQIHASIQGVEEKLVRMASTSSADEALGLKLTVTLGDIAFLVEDVFKGRSAITGLSTRVTLTRWRRPAGSTVVRIGEGKDEQRSSNLKLSDLVCMTKDEAKVHETEVLKGGKRPEDLYDSEVLQRVEAKQKECRVWEQFR